MSATVFSGRTILAPLTKGGNLPFRRLCVEHGARITVSEMAYARQVQRRSRSEMALLRRHESEPCFGVQIAARRPEEAVAAGEIAVEKGADFVDLNCGCPIHDTVRRGMGAALLERPGAIARIVEAMVEALPVPVTVKIRSGRSPSAINALEVGQRIQDAGATALTLHARTREQRYSKAADWDLVARLVEKLSIPVIGNGDILTWYEARMRKQHSGCAALMIGRGALIKPWIFEEIERGLDLDPSARERVAILRRLTVFMREHFGDDERGRARAMRFLPWHLGFFCRYRPLPATRFEAIARRHPLLQTRMPIERDLDPLEALLRDPREEQHTRIAGELWEACDDEDAIQRLLHLAREHPGIPGGTVETAVSNG